MVARDVAHGLAAVACSGCRRPVPGRVRQRRCLLALLTVPVLQWLVVAEPATGEGGEWFPSALRELVQAGRFPESVGWLRKAQQVSADPIHRWFDGIVTEARLRGKLRQVSEALATWQRAAANDATPVLLQGDLLSLVGDWREALARYQQAQQVAPDSPEPLRRLARLHAERGDYLIAETELRAAAGRAPGHGPTQADQLRLLIQAGRVREATEALRREGEQTASAVRGAQRAAVLGEALLHQSDAEADAATAYQQALALEPGNGDALFGMAALAEHADAPDAYERWQQFLNVEPYGRRAEAVRLGWAVTGLTDLVYEERQYAGSPEFSPDGRHLVLQDRKMKALWMWSFPDLQQARTVTTGGATGADWDPSWSPRGDWLLFRREQGAKPGLYAVFPFGTEPRCLLPEEEGRQIHDPSWSPDGRRVLFRRSPDGLCLLDLASGKTRVLGVLKTGQFLFEPRFAPDGVSLVASTYPDPKGVNIIPETVVELGFVGDALQPKPKVQPLTSLGAASRQPAPSPDGMRVAFACNAFDRKRHDLWLLDYRAPEAPVSLVPSLGEWQKGAFRPAWSPDGRQLVFPRDQHLWVLTLGGLPTIPVHVAAETTGGKATVTVRSFANQPLHLNLFQVWYDDNSVLLADNWDTPGEAVDLEPKGTQQVVLSFPKTKAPPATLKTYLFDPERNCVIRLSRVTGGQ